MKQIYVRPVRPEDTKDYLEWVKNQPGWDASIALQPRTFTLAAYDRDKVIMYLPTQETMFIETASINPSASDSEVSTAFKELIKFLVSQCHIKGMSELYFLGTNDLTNSFAVRRIFKELPYKIFRVKLSDLESCKPVD